MKLKIIALLSCLVFIFGCSEDYYLIVSGSGNNNITNNYNITNVNYTFNESGNITADNFFGTYRTHSGVLTIEGQNYTRIGNGTPIDYEDEKEKKK
jgi:hypothetical protein